MCDDGRFCNGAESCAPSVGCQAGTPPSPDDSIACTVDSCRESDDSFQHAPNSGLCQNGLFCDGSEVCSVSQGCIGGTAPSLTDGVACTVDSCNEDTDAILHTPDHGACGSGFECSPGGCVDINECARGLHDCSPNARCNNTFGSFTCRCNTNFEGDGRTCVPRCDPVTLATGTTRCVRAREDGTVDHRESLTSSLWSAPYHQSGEPVQNFCGPTAVKNFLSWYGQDEDYLVLGDEMHTNTWDGPAVFGAVVLLGPLVGCIEPICWGIATAVLSDSVVKAGTLPVDMRAALDLRAPEGYTACIKQWDNNFENLRGALAEGNEVVYLESSETDQLHWAVATGIFLSDGELWVNVANSHSRRWTDFERDWSLSPVGDSFKRGLLATVLGLAPYTMIRWIPSELASGESCP